MKLLRVSWCVLLIGFLTLFIWLLWKGLYVEKDFIKKTDESSFPEFALNDIRNSRPLTLDNIKGHPSVVHIWAMWCSVCVKEHNEWITIKSKWSYPIIGVLYRDDSTHVFELLKQKGDPFTYLLNDSTGKLGLDLGITGIPESYILDDKGVIRFHHTGPVSVQSFESIFLPLLNQLDNLKS